ncbi:MAG: energy-coupling factor transporter transmembrane protein EcfT [Clostridia bacterium]|nr:energy-coupling factor transporter transmembrane protein EcfT [Clostridia bacterium]
MLKDITLGQYFPGDSIIHRLDPRAKMILSILYIVAIFFAKNVFSFVILTLSAILLVLISRIPLLTVLRGLKPVFFILLFTMVINLFLTTSTEESPLFAWNIPVFSWTWQITIYRIGILRAIFTALRVILLLSVSSVFLTYTTSPITLTDSLEDLMGPLKVIRVPVHDIAMIITIALRFIPTLIEETDKIMNAQKARGADFATGSLVRRAKALIPVLVPLFVSSFKRADDLAIAMECRCYRGGEGRTKLHKLRYHLRDLLAAILMVALFASVLFVNHINPLGIGL